MGNILNIPHPQMGPKAWGLAQHGGPSGWRRITRQVWFCAWWKGRTAPIALIGAAQLRAVGISSCCYIVNAQNHPLWATSRKEGMAWYSSWPMPSLCSSPPHPPHPPPKPTHRLSYPPLIQACSPTPTFRSKIPKCSILKDALRRNTGLLWSINFFNPF